MRTISPRAVLALFVLFVVLIAWFGLTLFRPSPPITVSKQTTFLTEPLGADGLPDYAQAILDRQREGVTRENNGAIPFWQAMWPGELSPSQYDPFLRELGIDEPAVGLRDLSSDRNLRRELMYLLLKKDGHESLAEEYRRRATGEEGEQFFVDPDSALLAERYEEDIYRMLEGIERPWTAAQIPPLAEWLRENVKLLDLLVEAGNRPKFYNPSPSLIGPEDNSVFSMLMPEVQAIRSAMWMLATRALFRVANRDYEEAWRDLFACYRLADHFSNQQSLIEELVSIACKGFADAATLRLLDQADLPHELAKQILRELQARKPHKAMADAMDRGERFCYLDQVIRLSRGEPGEWEESELPSILGRMSIDWDIMLRDGNVWYDRIAEAGRLEAWNERQAAFEEIENDLEALPPSAVKIAVSLFSRESRSRRMGEMLGSLFLPAISAAFRAEDRNNTQLDLMRLAAGLAVHRIENGVYPDSLDALVPAVLEKLPVDLFHQKSFVYQKTRNGYLLYSLGANGLDDGGSANQWQRYKGYEFDEENAWLIRRMLSETSPAEEDAETEGGEYPGYEDDLVSQADYKALEELIPAGADDHSLRLPRPKLPLPVLKE